MGRVSQGFRLCRLTVKLEHNYLAPKGIPKGIPAPIILKVLYFLIVIQEALMAIAGSTDLHSDVE